MVFKLFVILFLVLVVFPRGQIYAQWTVQQVPTTATLTDVYFADSANGWVSSNGGIFHTTDGGKTWLLQDSSRTGCLAGLSKDLCWARYGTNLLHTTDSGIHWTLALLDTLLKGNFNRLGRIVFVDSLTGWVPALGNRGAVAILKTTNGGEHWSISYPSLLGYFYFISFVDRNYGWIRDQLFTYRTTDGGTTWDSLGFFGYNTTMDMQFLTRQIGWLTRDGPAEETVVCKTTDGGKSWFYQKDFMLSDWTTYCYFTDTSNGWVAQTTGLDGVHTEVWHTSDGGTNWQKQYDYYTNFYFRARRLFFTDTMHGWIAGENGIILHTSNGGGTTGIQKEPYTIPENFGLLQNFPNPFNPKTMIKYELPMDGRITLKVYNVLGQTVATLIDELQYAGYKSVEWNAKEVASGFYLYRLEAVSVVDPSKTFIQVKKMILLK